MPDDTEGDEYELLPHKEIQELKEELSKLKEFEIAPSKKMHVSLLELNTKLDKLITIFEDASHDLRVEEGGVNFADKMRPVVEKMNKILEQNSEIASGILALADLIKGKEERTEKSAFLDTPPGLPPLRAESSSLPDMPPLPPPRRRTFGL